MPGEPAHITSTLVARAARLLDPGEREVVLGDIAESGISTGRAVLDIVGLAARRQLAAWRDWQPWFAMMLVVLPTGLLLSIVSRFWGDSVIGTVHIYAYHWGDWNYFTNPGLQEYLVQLTKYALLFAVTLACWSWTCGLALGALSSRTSWTNAALFVLMLFAGSLGTTTIGRITGVDANLNSRYAPFVFASVLPVVFRLMVLALPAIAAVACTSRRRPLRLRTSAFWALATTVLTLVSVRGIQSSLVFGWVASGDYSSGALLKNPPMQRTITILGSQWLPGADGVTGTADDLLRWPLQVLPFVLLLPILCTLATSFVCQARPTPTKNTQS